MLYCVQMKTEIINILKYMLALVLVTLPLLFAVVVESTASSGDIAAENSQNR